MSWLLVCNGSGNVTISVTPYGTDENTDEPALAENIESDNVTIQQILEGEFTLTMLINGQGTTTPAEGTHPYPAGEVVGITADAAEDWEFVNWTGDVADPNEPTTTVTMDEDQEITANFEPEEGIAYDVPLAVDWNYFSIPLVPLDSDIDAVLLSIDGAYVDVWSYDSCTLTWQTYLPGQPDAYYTNIGVEKLEEIVDGYGYIIHMDEAANLTGIGLEYEVGVALPPTYLICGSWSLVGYKAMDFNDDGQITQADDAMRVDYYLQTLDWDLDDLVIADEVTFLRYYDPADGQFYELTNDEDMLVGYGLWLYLIDLWWWGEIVPPIAQEGP